MFRFSIGAGDLRSSPPPVLRNRKMTPARSRMGSSSRIRVWKEKRLFVSGDVWFVMIYLLLRSWQDFEHAVPAEFCKFRDVRMEHIHARIFVCELENPALCLTLNDGVSKFRGREAGASGIVVEEVGMQMEGVDEIEFENVYKIYANGLADFDLNRMILIIER